MFLSVFRGLTQASEKVMRKFTIFLYINFPFPWGFLFFWGVKFPFGNGH